MNSNYEKAKRIFESLRKRLHEDPTPEPNSGKHLEIVKSAVRDQFLKDKAVAEMESIRQHRNKPQVKSQLIKLVKTYQLTSGLNERFRLVEAIFHLIEPDLRAIVFSAIVPHAAKDVLQEVLISITNSLKNFKGGSKEEFSKWCYKIARRRIYDHIRKIASDRLQPMPHEERLDLVDASARLRSPVRNYPRSRQRRRTGKT